MATIRKRNSRYHVQVRKKGYPSTTKTLNSLTGARKWAVGIEADMERRLYVVITDDTTVGQLLERYDTEVLPTHKGQQAERYRLRTLSKYFANIRLANFIPKEVAKYRDLRLKEVSPASLKRELKILSRVLTLASKDWGIAVPQNPVTMITLPKSDKARTRRLELGEEERLRHGSNYQLNRIIVLAIETAMRRGEILCIKKSHIDFRNRTLLIPDTKTDRPRRIPLSTRAIKALREQLRTSQGYTEGVVSLHETPLFSYRPRGLTGAFLKLCRRVGIEDLHFHDLRHEATSRFFEKGLNPVEVATITGHKDTKMLMRYTHLRAEDLVERLG